MWVLQKQAMGCGPSGLRLPTAFPGYSQLTYFIFKFKVWESQRHPDTDRTSPSVGDNEVDVSSTAQQLQGPPGRPAAGRGRVGVTGGSDDARSQLRLLSQLGGHVNVPLASQPFQTPVLSGLLLTRIPIHVSFCEPINHASDLQEHYLQLSTNMLCVN